VEQVEAGSIAPLPASALDQVVEGRIGEPPFVGSAVGLEQKPEEVLRSA
jgi:hypothetical protein